MNTRLMSAGTIKEDSVKNLEDKDIGSIEELMINPETGKVEYAVLSFGGFLGIGDKYFAIPWEAMDIDRENKVLRLDVTKEHLENAPGFDKDNWPDFSDDTFLHSINKSYSGIGRHTYRPN